LTDVVQAALIVSIAPTIAAVAGIFISIRNGNKLNAVHVDINSRLSAALKSERALGVEEGRRIENEKTEVS